MLNPKNIKAVYKQLFVLFIAFNFLQCDKIEDPNIRQLNTLNSELYPGSSDYVIPEFGDFPTNHLKVLIEDFTGHKCGFCPGAGVKLELLKDQFPDIVVPVAIHAGPIGSTFQTVDNNFPREFRTEAGNQYAIDFGVFANPMGTFNRIRYQDPVTGNIGQILPFWDNTFAIAREKELKAKVQIITNYYEETRGLFIHVQSQFLDNLQGDYSLTVMLLESNIISPQRIYANQHPDYPQGGDIQNFVHNHVLINHINGTYGETLKTGSTQTGETFENHYTYQVPTLHNQENLYVVALVYNVETFEVLQVEELKVGISEVVE